MLGKPRILFYFCNKINKFYKFNNTEARMFNYIYHMTFEYFVIACFVWKRHQFAKYMWRCYEHYFITYQSVNH